MFIYQEVINVGIQILVVICVGWMFSRFGWVDQARFMPQVNLLILQVALPTFNLYLVGIKLDLQDTEAWRFMGAFMLWTVILQVAILLYTWRFCGGDAAEAGMLNMNLLMLNYGILGLLALQAVLGQPLANLALLTTVSFFLLMLPFTLFAFEWEKWVLAHRAAAGLQAVDMEKGDLAKGHEAGGGAALPLETAGGGTVLLSDAAWAVQPPPPASGAGASRGGGSSDGVDASSQNFRYCWWMNEDYKPHREPLLAGAPADGQSAEGAVPKNSTHPYYLPKLQHHNAPAAAAAAAGGTAYQAAPFSISDAVQLLDASAPISTAAAGGGTAAAAAAMAARRQAAEAEAAGGLPRSALMALADSLVGAGSNKPPRRYFGDLGRVAGLETATSVTTTTADGLDPSVPLNLVHLEYGMTHQLSAQPGAATLRSRPASPVGSPYRGGRASAAGGGARVLSPFAAAAMAGGGGGASPGGLGSGSGAPAAAGSEVLMHLTPALSLSAAPSLAVSLTPAVAAAPSPPVTGSGYDSGMVGVVLAPASSAHSPRPSLQGAAHVQELTQLRRRAPLQHDGEARNAAGGGGGSRAVQDDNESEYNYRMYERQERQAIVREATSRVLAHHGGVIAATVGFFRTHPQLGHILKVLAKNPMVWTVFLSVLVSASGLRKFLDVKAGPSYIHGLGWIAGALAWLNALTVPLSLFANGAWMYGKSILPPRGARLKVAVMFALKLFVLPMLMLGCAKLVGLKGPTGAALVLVTLSPPAAANFALAVQYGRGVETVTLFNVVGVAILAPMLMAWVQFLNWSGLMHFEVHSAT